MNNLLLDIAHNILHKCKSPLMILINHISVSFIKNLQRRKNECFAKLVNGFSLKSEISSLRKKLMVSQFSTLKAVRLLPALSSYDNPEEGSHTLQQKLDGSFFHDFPNLF